jgi:polyhydroxyalkanoate synthesis regulator phasin
MLESIKQYAEALSGLTEVPRKRARRIATSLSKQGVISTEQVRAVASGIIERSRENRHRITELVAAQVRVRAGAIGLATSDEIDRLRRRVVALEGSGGAKKRSTLAKPVPKRAAPVTKTAKRSARAAAPTKPKTASRTRTQARSRARKPRKRASATRRV